MKIENQILYSNCCYTEDTGACEDGPNYSELGRCPDCEEHCEFLTEDEMEALQS